MQHEMSLKSEYFEKIRSGTKTIECRLYDDKRKAITVGDTIRFTNAQNESEQVECTVTALHPFSTFKELIDHFSIASLGGETPEQFLGVLQAFYSPEAEAEHGVVGIEVEVA